MSPIFSARPRASRRLSGRRINQRGFSLVEIVIALAVIATALISVVGLMAITMVSHQDSSVDSVFAIMTETALQEVRNYNAPNVNPKTGTYNFAKLQGYTGYIYFDEDGQVTHDAPSAGTSTEIGTPAGSANTGTPGTPLTAAMATTNPTFYTCTITTVQPIITYGSTTATSSMILIKLTFTWQGGKSRVIMSSLSNNSN